MFYVNLMMFQRFFNNRFRILEIKIYLTMSSATLIKNYYVAFVQIRTYP